jgi:RNA 2',3'-cyclic 3'-phosphodiesterase
LRLFVAVYPPPEAADHLADFLTGLHLGRAADKGVNARLATRAHWHVTLAFLGEVADERVPRAAAALDLVPVELPAPVLRIAGAGRFGRGRFTIVWAGMGGDVTELSTLAKRVRRELRRARLPYDEKPLRPHLTLARPGDRLPAEEIAADLAALREYEGPEWTVEAVRLMRSHLGPHPRYDVLHSVPLVVAPT